LHRAVLRNVPSEAPPSWWNAELAAVPQSTVLIGAVLSSNERQNLVARHPKIHFIFFLPRSEAQGESTLTVDRAEAWSLVASKAAAIEAQPATVLFPGDTTNAEVARVEAAWHLAGGGVLSIILWPRIGTSFLSQGTVFQWAGPEADASVLSLAPNRLVAGNPGMARTPGARGLTWQIREAGLGDFLWSAVQTKNAESSFLPLDTATTSR